MGTRWARENTPSGRSRRSTDPAVSLRRYTILKRSGAERVDRPLAVAVITSVYFPGAKRADALVRPANLIELTPATPAFVSEFDEPRRVHAWWRRLRRVTLTQPRPSLRPGSWTVNVSLTFAASLRVKPKRVPTGRRCLPLPSDERHVRCDPRDVRERRGGAARARRARRVPTPDARARVVPIVVGPRLSGPVQYVWDSNPKMTAQGPISVRVGAVAGRGP